jgi:hypothetical protein
VVFDRLTAFVAARNPRLYAALEGGGIAERREGALTLRAATRFTQQRLSGKREELEAICAEFFGAPTRVEVKLDGEAAEAAAGPGRAVAPEDVRDARQRALNHPAVGTALEVLDGEIAEIRPVQPGGGR